MSRTVPMLLCSLSISSRMLTISSWVYPNSEANLKLCTQNLASRFGEQQQQQQQHVCALSGPRISHLRPSIRSYPEVDLTLGRASDDRGLVGITRCTDRLLAVRQRLWSLADLPTRGIGQTEGTKKSKARRTTLIDPRNGAQSQVTNREPNPKKKRHHHAHQRSQRRIIAPAAIGEWALQFLHSGARMDNATAAGGQRPSGSAQRSGTAQASCARLGALLASDA